ncbi:M48 family metalloprotease [Salinibacterium sp.]|uniref:M56 family metallopeptidase n=1 Tax=Salinibacterium sp. TaxID=1915057 RepID=UPI00286A03C7|nr:M48 family metalloprotease [Salinibacterium sp.]
MIYSLYIPLVVGCLMGMAAPGVARRLAPAAATRLLSAVAVVSAAATTGTLVLLAVGGMIKVAPLFGIGASREALIDGRDGVPWPVGVAGVVMLLVLIMRISLTVSRERRIVKDLNELVDEHRGGLMVLDDPRFYAYAVPVGMGTIIVSTAMLNSLTENERKALLAHERAHLKHRHRLHRTITSLAAATNPLLNRVHREMELQTERWADETAAAQTTRAVTATSLAKAALASTGSPKAALAYVSNHVRDRITALAVPPPISNWNQAVPIAIAGVVISVALLDAVHACATVLALWYP